MSCQIQNCKCSPVKTDNVKHFQIAILQAVILAVFITFNPRWAVFELIHFFLSPYLICAMSPTTISDTRIWITCPARTTVNFCSWSMRLWSPRNCFSLLQSLKAVTRTTQTTDRRMATPSIHPASASLSSTTPPAALPQSEQRQRVSTLSYFTLLI